MSLVSDIITDAYRETNLIALGKAPNSTQQAEALRRLQALISSVFGSSVGENLNDWPLGNYGRDALTRWDASQQITNRPQINSRLIATAEEARDVQLPPYPSDGSRIAIIDPYSRLAAFPVTLEGNGRAIEAVASIVLDTNGMNRAWMFRADTGNWVRITDLTLPGDMPFPSEFDDYFMIALAVRLNPRYGASMTPESAARLKQQHTQLVARYVQSAPLEQNPDIAFTSRQSYGNFRGPYSGTNENFNRGGGWWG